MFNSSNVSRTLHNDSNPRETSDIQEAQTVINELENIIQQHKAMMNGDPANDQARKQEISALRYAIAAINSMPK